MANSRSCLDSIKDCITDGLDPKTKVKEDGSEEIMAGSFTGGSTTSDSSRDWRSSMNFRDSETEDPFSSSSRRSSSRWENYTVYKKYDEEMMLLDRVSAQKLAETGVLYSSGITMLVWFFVYGLTHFRFIYLCAMFRIIKVNRSEPKIGFPENVKENYNNEQTFAEECYPVPRIGGCLRSSSMLGLGSTPLELQQYKKNKGIGYS